MWDFWQRPFPDANVVLLRGPAPVLIDSGEAGSAAALRAWLAALGVPRPALLANTHHHGDHVGGNATLAALGVPIAAHAAEAAMRAGPAAGPEADPGDARWLGHVIPPYAVDRVLTDGDLIETGAARWRVVHTPGHSVGHCTFFDPATRALVGGDTVFADGIAWLPPAARDPRAFGDAADSLARLTALRPAVIAPGHGPLIIDPAQVLEAAARRLARLTADPALAARHAARRIAMHAILVGQGVDAAGVDAMAALPWCGDCAAASGMGSAAFLDSILADLIGSGAATRAADGRTIAAGGR